MKVPSPHSRTPAFALFAVAALCGLAGLALAFTLYGELAILVGVGTAVYAAVLLGRSTDPRGRMTFQPPPGWPDPPSGWRPTSGWRPDPSWPEAPSDWRFWVPRDGGNREA